MFSLSILRALAEADAFMVANESLPLDKRVNAYLANQRRDLAEDPPLNEETPQGEDATEHSPPFQPSGSEYLTLPATPSS